MSTRLFAPLGTPVHESGGETSSPWHVCFFGMAPFGWNAADRISRLISFPFGVDVTIDKASSMVELMVGRSMPRLRSGVTPEVVPAARVPVIVLG